VNHTPIDKSSERRKHGDSEDMQIREETSDSGQPSELGSFRGEGAMAKVHGSSSNHDAGNA
jgi:hypothetical protein